MKRLDQRISTALDEVQSAEQRLAAVVAKVRSSCLHDIVYHQAGYNGTPLPDQFCGSRHHEMRTCAACGLTEEGNWGRFKVLTTDVIVPVPHVAPYRLPYAAERPAPAPARDTQAALRSAQPNTNTGEIA